VTLVISNLGPQCFGNNSLVPLLESLLSQSDKDLVELVDRALSSDLLEADLFLELLSPLVEALSENAQASKQIFEIKEHYLFLRMTCCEWQYLYFRWLCYLKVHKPSSPFFNKLTE